MCVCFFFAYSFNAGTGTNFVRESIRVASVCYFSLVFLSVSFFPVQRCSYWLSGFRVLWILQIKFVQKSENKKKNNNTGKIPNPTIKYKSNDWYGALRFLFLIFSPLKWFHSTSLHMRYAHITSATFTSRFTSHYFLFWCIWFCLALCLGDSCSLSFLSLFDSWKSV